jgi:hypothetical protein
MLAVCNEPIIISLRTRPSFPWLDRVFLEGVSPAYKYWDARVWITHRFYLGTDPDSNRITHLVCTLRVHRFV